MGTKLSNSGEMKRNMEIALEWISDLGFKIYTASVYDFNITLMSDDRSAEALHRMLEVAKEKGVSFDISHDSDTGFSYYTSKEAGLRIIFTN